MTTICPVCYQEVPVIQHAVVDLNVRMSVTCHGSTESKTFNGVTFMTAYEGETPRAVEEWFRKVFTSDTHPDVMLAIRYSQGRTMKEPA